VLGTELVRGQMGMLHPQLVHGREGQGGLLQRLDEIAMHGKTGNEVET
jgi:hypothetical protein